MPHATDSATIGAAPPRFFTPSCRTSAVICDREYEIATVPRAPTTSVLRTVRLPDPNTVVHDEPGAAAMVSGAPRPIAPARPGAGANGLAMTVGAGPSTSTTRMRAGERRTEGRSSPIERTWGAGADSGAGAASGEGAGEDGEGEAGAGESGETGSSDGGGGAFGSSTG